MSGKKKSLLHSAKAERVVRRARWVNVLPCGTDGRAGGCISGYLGIRHDTPMPD